MKEQGEGGRQGSGLSFPKIVATVLWQVNYLDASRHDHQTRDWGAKMLWGQWCLASFCRDLGAGEAFMESLAITRPKTEVCVFSAVLQSIFNSIHVQYDKVNPSQLLDILVLCLINRPFIWTHPCLCVQFWESRLSSFPRVNHDTSKSLEKHHFNRVAITVLVLNCGIRPLSWRKSSLGIYFLPYTQYFKVIQSQHSVNAAARMGETLQASILLHLDLKYHAQLLTASPGNFLHLFCSGKQVLETWSWVSSAAWNGQWFIKTSCRCRNAQVANKQALWNKTKG